MIQKTLLIQLLSLLLLSLLLRLGYSTVQAQESVTSRSRSVVTKVGNPVGPPPAGNFVYYCQGDPKWDDRTACGLGQVGCGPTSLAMVMSSFGDTVTPSDLFNLAESASPPMLTCSAGTYPDLLFLGSWLRDRGYEVGPNLALGGALDVDTASSYLAKGSYIIGSSNDFRSYVSGATIQHIFVIQSINPTAGTFENRDPANCSYTTGTEVSSRTTQKISGFFHWAYAYPIKRIK